MSVKRWLMPLEDLDLEFEDEEEIKRKKKEAVEVDVDLEFQAPQGTAPKPRAPSPGGPPPRPGAQVKNISEARAQSAPPQQGPRSVGANALRVESQPQSNEVQELRAELQAAKLDVAVKDAILDFKVDLLSELLGDVKLLDFQVGQVLTRLAAKHPDSKQELLMIKKLLADFSAKKRK
jgi:hypothetical protein